MSNLKINHLAVLVSVVWMFILGFSWYGFIFGETWMQMEGLTMADAEANPPGAGVWIANVVSSVLPIYLLAWFFVKMDVHNAVSGALHGFLVGFVFYHLPNMTGGMFAYEPYGLAWINGGFQMVGWTVSGLILGAWTKTK